MVGPEIDQVLDLLVRREEVERLPRLLVVFGRNDILHDAADTLKRVDRRILVVRSEFPRKDDMTVENAPDRVRDRFVDVVPFHEDGIDARNAAHVRRPRALEQFRQEGKYRRGVSSRGGGFSGGEPDLPLGHGDPGHRIHEEQDVHPLFPEELGDRGGGQPALHPEDRRLVGRHGHHDRFLQALFAQVPLDELPHFPSPLPDQGDDVDIRFGVPADHPHQDGLADATATEYADTLSPADRREVIDRLDPGHEGFPDSGPLQGRGRGVVEMDERLGLDGSLAIDRLADGVDDPSSQGVPHLDSETALQRNDVVVLLDPVQLAVGHEQNLAALDADDLCALLSMTVLGIDLTDIADPAVQPGGFDDQPDDLVDLAHDTERFGVVDLGEVLRVPVGDLSHRQTPSSSP